MKVLSKSEANKAVLDSLFKPVDGRTLAAEKKTRFDLGKYQSSIIGREVPEGASKARLIWAERRTDKYGVYFALYCIL